MDIKNVVGAEKLNLYVDRIYVCPNPSFFAVFLSLLNYKYVTLNLSFLYKKIWFRNQIQYFSNTTKIPKNYIQPRHLTLLHVYRIYNALFTDHLFISIKEVTFINRNVHPKV